MIASYLYNLDQEIKDFPNYHNRNSTMCPDYTNFWLSDVECKTGQENNLSSCYLNSSWGEHTCSSDECIFVACDGENDIQKFLKYKDGDLKFGINDIILIYHNNEWRPISDSGNEYNPKQGYYGKGINKASAHVICK